MHNIVSNRRVFGYNQAMSQNSEKKSEQILINIEPSSFRVLAHIAETEDRPLGYVARELMVRGLALYAADGNLKDNSSMENVFHNALQKAIPPNSVKAAEVRVRKDPGKVVARIGPGKENVSKDDVRKMVEKDLKQSPKRRRAG